MWKFALHGFGFNALVALALLLSAVRSCEHRQNPVLELEDVVRKLGARHAGCDPLDTPREASWAGSSAGLRGGRVSDVRRVWITLGNALLAGFGCEDWRPCPGRPTCGQVSSPGKPTCSLIPCPGRPIFSTESCHKKKPNMHSHAVK